MCVCSPDKRPTTKIRPFSKMMLIVAIGKCLVCMIGYNRFEYTCLEVKFRRIRDSEYYCNYFDKSEGGDCDDHIGEATTFREVES